MPRVSKRQKAITCLEKLFHNRMKGKAIRMLDDDDDDDDSLEDMKDLATAICLSEICKRRYFDRPHKYRNFI